MDAVDACRDFIGAIFATVFRLMHRNRPARKLHVRTPIASVDLEASPFNMICFGFRIAFKVPSTDFLLLGKKTCARSNSPQPQPFNSPRHVRVLAVVAAVTRVSLTALECPQSLSTVAAGSILNGTAFDRRRLSLYAWPIAGVTGWRMRSVLVS